MLGAVAAGGYLYVHLNDEIRRQVERRLAEFYRDFDVHVGSARFDADQGIAISDLTISCKGRPPKEESVLVIEEMYLAGKLRMDQLVTGQLPIEDINVRGAKLHAVHEKDGHWNSAALLPLPHFGKEAPRVKIENAVATIEDAAQSANKPFLINDVTLQLSPSAKTAASGAATSFHVEGSTTSLPAKSIRLTGELNCAGGGFNVEIKADGLELSSEMLATLPGTWIEKLHGVEFGGRTDLVLIVSRPGGDAALNWSATYKVDHGQLSHPLLPDPLTDISLTGKADTTHLVVEQFTARCGSASLAAAMERAGWSEGAPLGLGARIVGLEVNDRMRAALPQASARVWDRFKPGGQADATIRVRFDGQKWRPEVVVNCHNMSLTDAEKFAYPLQQASGQIEYHPAENGSPDKLQIDLTGVGAGRPVKVEVDLRDVVRAESDGLTTDTGVASEEATPLPGDHRVGYRGMRPQLVSHPVGFIKVYATDVPIHEQLLAAIPRDRAQPFTRSLQPQGLIDFQFCCEWKEPSQPLPHVTLDIALKDCRIQFERFRYPLQHVRGLVKADNWHWTLSDIEGRGVNDSTIVKCRGTAIPNSGGYDADLYFDGSDVPLDDTLRVSLPPAGQKAWADMRPQGRIDFHAHAKKAADELEPDVEVSLQPRDKSVSIEPSMFPYRLEQVGGQVVYRSGRAELHNIVALHDRTMYSAESGMWQATADGSWQIALSKLNADRLVLTRELLSALPPGLQSAIDRFQPSGTFVLINSNVNLSKQPQVGVSAAWDVNLECQQASIQSAVPLHGITGGVHLVGRSDGHSAVTAGELGIDSVIVKDLQLTNVRGPFWTDGSRVLVGEPACVQEAQALRRLTADAYGGSLAANIDLLRTANPSFKLDVQIGGANLGRFANERLGGPNDMGGTVSGKLVLSGTGQTAQTLRGVGELHVVDGHIYQMPLLVSLLSVLKNKTPDTTAFNRCDTQFEVQGEHVQFRQLNLLGDAVSLYGSGEVDLNRRLDLEFVTLPAPADLPIPFLKTIAGHLSQQALQLKVVGTFDDPKIERKVLPAVNNAMERFQNELQEGASSVSPNSASRGARAPTK